VIPSAEVIGDGGFGDDGRQRRDQGRLFYEIRLDDRIPQNHLLRRIDVFVTAALADLHQELEPYYSDIGRPSVDPGSERAKPLMLPTLSTASVSNRLCGALKLVS
jgi:hypothetical protein